MPQRTNIPAVQLYLGADYGRLPDGTLPPLQQYIDTAWPIVDQVQAKAALRKKTLTDFQLEIIERILSCMYYCRMDQTYTQRTTTDASGSFATPKNDTEKYRQAAIEADTSGSLNALLNRLTAGADWLGKPPSAQVPIWERD